MTDSEVSWTYDPDDLLSDSDEGRLARTRLHLGDTISQRPLLGDNEIAYFLSQNGNNERLAASKAALAVATRYAGMPSRTIGDLRIDYQQVVSSMTERAAILKSEAALSGGVGPWMGAHKKADKEANENDSSLVAPFARIGRHDNPQSGGEYNELRADI